MTHFPGPPPHSTCLFPPARRRFPVYNTVLPPLRSSVRDVGFGEPRSTPFSFLCSPRKNSVRSFPHVTSFPHWIPILPFRLIFILSQMFAEQPERSPFSSLLCCSSSRSFKKLVQKRPRRAPVSPELLFVSRSSFAKYDDWLRSRR